MKIVLLNNETRVKGAVETVVEDTAYVLSKNGHRVILMARNSNSVAGRLSGKVRAFFSGIYSFSAYRDVATLIEREKPDLVHAHNLYPLLSPSVLAACRRKSVPAILTYHDYRETCPTYFHWHGEQICESCAGGHEYYCILKNCRGRILESAAHAVRSAVARKFRLIEKNATVLMALTEFSKRRLCAAGFEERRIAVVPNMARINGAIDGNPPGDFVGFSGRLRPEKGVEILLAAARQNGLPVVIAGDGPMWGKLVPQAPPNVRFLGQVDHEQIGAFYRQARFLVVPSRWFEVCPLVILEAMSNGKAVLASRTGGLGELVDDGVTGLLFRTGDVADLVAKIDLLWNDVGRCAQMGRAARERAVAQHGEQVFYERLMAAYEKALTLNEEVSRR